MPATQEHATLADWTAAFDAALLSSYGIDHADAGLDQDDLLRWTDLLPEIAADKFADKYGLRLLPNRAALYRLIQTIDGQMIQTEGPFGNVVAALEARGFPLHGYNRNPRHRAELQGAPIFVGLCGPCWDGNAIRYEDRESNQRLSL